jgi:hypothetical protein
MPHRHGRAEKYVQNLSPETNFNGRDYLGDAEVKDRLILKSTLKE